MQRAFRSRGVAFFDIRPSSITFFLLPHSKMTPRRLQVATWAQLGSILASSWPPRGPQEAPRGPQEAPKRPNLAPSRPHLESYLCLLMPRSAKLPPSCLHDGSRSDLRPMLAPSSPHLGPQDARKRPQEAPKRSQEAPSSSQNLSLYVGGVPSSYHTQLRAICRR